MSVRDTITNDLKTAMKAKDMETISVLRFVQAAIKNCEIDKRPNPITESDILGVLKKLVKQRKDSIEQFAAANRQDLVDKEKHELVLIETYLPAQLDEEQLKAIVDAAVTEAGATSAKDMGAVMKIVMAKTQGNADNKLISQLVKQRLS